MNLLSFATVFIATLLFVLSPGPGVVALLARGLALGFAPAFFLGLGEILGDMVYFSLAVVSLGALADTLAPYMIWVRLLGALYLGWIGWQQLKAPPIVKLPEAKLSNTDILRTIGTGFLISGTNPKVVVYYLSLLPLVTDLHGINGGAVFFLWLAVFSALLIGVFLYSYFCKQMRNYLDRPAFAIWLNRISGGMMIAVGIVIISKIHW